MFLALLVAFASGGFSAISHGGSVMVPFDDSTGGMSGGH
jgi:hypothetical protein